MDAGVPLRVKTCLVVTVKARARTGRWFHKRERNASLQGKKKQMRWPARLRKSNHLPEAGTKKKQNSNSFLAKQKRKENEAYLSHKETWMGGGEAGKRGKKTNSSRGNEVGVQPSKKKLTPTQAAKSGGLTDHSSPGGRPGGGKC